MKIFVAVICLFTGILSSFANAGSGSLTPLPVNSRDCQIRFIDPDVGIDFRSNRFAVTRHNSTDKSSASFISLWEHKIGADGSAIFSVFEPFLNSKNKLVVHLSLERSNVVSNSGNQEKFSTLDLKGSESSNNKVILQGYESNAIDNSALKQRVSYVGTLNNNELSVEGKSKFNYSFNLKCKVNR